MKSASPGLRWDEAQARIAAAVVPVAERETVALGAAAGRVLADDLVAPIDVPAHVNAAMDGFAVRSADGDATRAVIGRSYAGHPHRGTVEAGQCVRIMTGAVVPAECDAVIPIEQVEDGGATMTPTSAPKAGQHVRRPGEDIRRHAIALAAGRRLGPADIGLAASLGLARLPVLRRARIAVFSTGDELRAVDATLDDGTIHDSNRPILLALLGRLDIETIDLGLVPDRPEALADALDRALAAKVDAIVSSGGVSTGDTDHTRAVFAARGTVDFWSLAIKPGRPMAFGRLGAEGPLFFGLPGNPVATMVAFHALVGDALLALAGAAPEPRPRWRLPCDRALTKQPGRTEFVRAVVHATADGWRVRPTADQGSGILRSMSEANALIVLAHDDGPVQLGDPVDVLPFYGLPGL